MTNRARITPISIALPAAAALALSACGGNGGEASPEDSPPAAEVQEETDQASAGDDSGEGSDASMSGAQHSGDLEAALAAISAAEDETDGTAFEIDFEDDDDDDDDGPHWKVDALSGDREWEVRITADGATVVDTEEDDADDDDVRELEAASVTLAEALEIAVADTPGTVDDASLDEDDGVLRWEVDVYPDGSSDSRDIDVDAETGEIIAG